jgi:3'-phosphoadenosine 5'-phosphosulfate sulfotransferase (PAPS reductase)/FAD synthetase
MQLGRGECGVSELHVVALSGGKDSTAMALRLQEVQPRNYVYVCTPTGNEPDNVFAHWRKLSQILGAPILPIMAGTLIGEIERQNALPNWRQRWCTRMLKIEPFAKWLLQQSERHDKIFTYVGLRADEEKREGGDYAEIPGINHCFPMRDSWFWELKDVLAYLAEKQIVIPERTDCKLCFFQRLIEWYELWLNDPEGWAEGKRLEALTGYTFRSPGRDTWPAALKDLEKEFKNGKIPKETRRDAFGALKCRVCRL